MGYCVLCKKKKKEVLDKKSDNILLHFKGEISELLFFEDYWVGD